MGRLDDDMTGDEGERVLTQARVLDQHHRAEGAAPLGRERIDQHLDRRIEPPVDRHAQQQLVAPGEHAPPDHVSRDRAHDQDDGHGGQEAEPREVASENALVHRREHVVDPAPENPEEPRGEEGGNRDEEASDESDFEPVPRADRHGFFEDSTSRHWRR